MVPAMRCLELVLVLAVIAACGGRVQPEQPYWADDDAGLFCVQHASQGLCNVCVGACNEGGPPDAADPSIDDLCSRIEPCSP
jgi:hypothetical protein